MCSRNLYVTMKERGDWDVKCVIVHRYEDNRLIELDGCEYCHSKAAHPVLKWWNMLLQILWLKKIKNEYQPDLTISTLGSCSTISLLAGGKEKKIGIFHSPHFQEKSRGLVVYLNTLLNYKYVYTKLDRIVCVSTEVKKNLLDNFSIYHNKDVRVVYNIHNFSDILCKSQEPLTNDEKMYVDQHTILYVGRLDRNKAPDRALRAFYLAIPKLPSDAKLCFVGKDHEGMQCELEKFVRNNNLFSRVYFMGFQSNPYKFLSKARCIISSSYSEGLPGVMIESLFLKKPVITTNSSEGVWEILSCHDDYQNNLQSNYITEDGIITPNSTDNQSYLSSAIVDVFYRKFDVSALFLNKIDKEQILHNFLDGLLV